EKTNAAGSGITIGNKASLQAIDSNPKGGTTFPMPGQISVVVGASVPGSPVRGTAPGNVTVTEGASPFQVYWGKNQIDTSTGNPNVITIQGSTAIVFSAGTMAPIKLNGETDFFADPPVGPAIAAGVSNRTPASVSSNTGSLVQAAAINQSNRAATSVASPSIGSLLTMTLPAVPTQTIMRSQEWTSLRSRQDGSAPRPRQSFIAREDSKYEAEDLDPDEVIVDTGDSE
ncbi:MAG: hypothetical protein K2X81_11860, partial [Candidatus Obscuribacterales bacterium]|nr:hypothetical protein [Candidatus Obscuribacterales bacterium]